MTCRISSRKVERNEADAAFPQDMYVTNRRKNPFRQTRKKQTVLMLRTQGWCLRLSRTPATGKTRVSGTQKKMVRRAPPFRAVRKADDMRAPGCIPEAVRRVLSAVEGQGRTPSLYSSRRRGNPVPVFSSGGKSVAVRFRESGWPGDGINKIIICL